MSVDDGNRPSTVEFTASARTALRATTGVNRETGRCRSSGTPIERQINEWRSQHAPL
jgi:hypothetical protein